MIVFNVVNQPDIALTHARKSFTGTLWADVERMGVTGDMGNSTRVRERELKAVNQNNKRINGRSNRAHLSRCVRAPRRVDFRHSRWTIASCE